MTRLLSNRAGAAAIEYGLLAGMLAAALVAVLLAVGQGADGTIRKADPSAVRRIEVRP